MSNHERLQWVLSLGIFHGPTFGHRADLWTDTMGRGAHQVEEWSWKGIGVPESKLVLMRSTVDAVLSDHLITRYGIAGELSLGWAGEPEPF